MSRAFISLLMLVFPVFSGCESPVTTVILVRHAEKASTPPGDPPLTAAGLARATALVGAVQRARISAIYTTQFQRTQQTAEPLAGELGVATTVFTRGSDPRPHAEHVAEDILARHKGQAVVVVDHSDSVPLIIQALGVASPPAIAEAEFDHLFVVVKHQDGDVRLIQGRYGSATP